jgi:8-oxo-dGTP pyrophosphatase MutT (NUDIX family)
LKRELLEEINYPVKVLHLLWRNQDEQCCRHVFWNTLEVPVRALTLLEGKDFQLVSAAEIRAGII